MPKLLEWPYGHYTDIAQKIEQELNGDSAPVYIGYAPRPDADQFDLGWIIERYEYDANKKLIRKSIQGGHSSSWATRATLFVDKKCPPIHGTIRVSALGVPVTDCLKFKDAEASGTLTVRHLVLSTTSLKIKTARASGAICAVRTLRSKAFAFDPRVSESQIKSRKVFGSVGVYSLLTPRVNVNTAEVFGDVSVVGFVLGEWRNELSVVNAAIAVVPYVEPNPVHARDAFAQIGVQSIVTATKT